MSNQDNETVMRWVDQLGHLAILVDRDGKSVPSFLLAISKATGARLNLLRPGQLSLLEPFQDPRLHPAADLFGTVKDWRKCSASKLIVGCYSPMALCAATAAEVWRVEVVDGKLRWRQATSSPLLMTTGQIAAEFYGIERTEPGRLGAALSQLSLYRRADPEIFDDWDRQNIAALEKKLASAGIDIDAALSATEQPFWSFEGFVAAVLEL
jgi:hypothetical protein